MVEDKLATVSMIMLDRRNRKVVASKTRKKSIKLGHLINHDNELQDANLFQLALLAKNSKWDYNIAAKSFQLVNPMFEDPFNDNSRFLGIKTTILRGKLLPQLSPDN